MLNDWKAEAEDNPIAEINITPLTDVMLVLLVIFMVTATF
ncbi:MAG: biopolymer transporter ExbD, partial [Armatimonadota bacterium]|nr:biopolymer transporter ExbD [Armatimonadota bacterium]